MGAFLDFLTCFLLVAVGLFLILLVLIQRGKGGGLAGALGGMGGQSAFGTKAGDVFTRVTIGVAAFWILLCAVAVKQFSVAGSGDRFGSVPAQAPASGALLPTPGGGGPAPTGPGGLGLPPLVEPPVPPGAPAPAPGGAPPAAPTS